MERNITIGLIIAFLLTCIGAFWLSSHSSGEGGFLLDFLKNVDNSTNSTVNNTINTTINETINNTRDKTNSTINETINVSFSADAVYDNNTNSVIVSITSDKENITVDNIALFTSYDNANFTKAKSLDNVTLPTTIDVVPEENKTILYYYVEILYNNATYRIPEAGAYNVTVNATLVANETAS